MAQILKAGLLLAATTQSLVQSVSSPASTPGVVSIPLHFIKNQTAYGAQIKVGTPPQAVTLLVDTGSATIGLESKLNYVCAKGLCDEYGVYNNKSSSTVKYVSHSYSDMVQDFGGGSFMNDTVRFDDHTAVPDFQFGVIEEYNSGRPITTPQAGFFGLGAVCRDPSHKCNEYPTVLQQLFDRGILARRVFSVYLGPNIANATGSVLLGGIDKAKRKGPVTTLKLQPDDSGQPNYTGVSAIHLQNAQGNTTTTYTYPKNSTLLWDTGAASWYMPDTIFQAVIQRLGRPADAQPSASGGYDVDCKYVKPTKEALVVQFGDTSSTASSVSIPLHYLVSQVAPDRCFTRASPGDGVLGDVFLRGAYVTFDYDRLELQVSSVEYTDKTDIVKIV